MTDTAQHERYRDHFLRTLRTSGFGWFDMQGEGEMPRCPTCGGTGDGPLEFPHSLSLQRVPACENCIGGWESLYPDPDPPREEPTFENQWCPDLWDVWEGLIDVVVDPRISPEITAILENMSVENLPPGYARQVQALRQLNSRHRVASPRTDDADDWYVFTDAQRSHA